MSYIQIHYAVPSSDHIQPNRSKQTQHPNFGILCQSNYVNQTMTDRKDYYSYLNSRPTFSVSPPFPHRHPDLQTRWTHSMDCRTNHLRLESHLDSDLRNSSLHCCMTVRCSYIIMFVRRKNETLFYLFLTGGVCTRRHQMDSD